MKRTFTVKTFAAYCFQSATFKGLAAILPYRVAEAQAACAGSVAGDHFITGATIGQDHHPGTTAGQCNG